MMMDRWQYENYMESIERKMKKQTINQRITNADKIRSMTDEELAEWLDKLIYSGAENLFNCENPPLIQCKDCKNCYLAWLQTEIR